MLCFSHGQLYSIFPHKDSCLGTRSDGEKGSKEAALKNVVPRSSCLSIKGSAASAASPFSGRSVHSSYCCEDVWLSAEQSTDESEWIKSPTR